MMDSTLPKSERFCGKTAVAALFETGKTLSAGCIRCKYLIRADKGPARIVVSVPKRHFKRAVKRNLLKRRIREAFRLNAGRLGGRSYDIFIYYVGKQVEDYERIDKSLAQVLDDLAAR